MRLAFGRLDDRLRCVGCVFLWWGGPTQNLRSAVASNGRKKIEIASAFLNRTGRSRSNYQRGLPSA